MIELDVDYQRVRDAIVLEASSKKLGNVHPTATFDDLTYETFVLAAEAIALAMQRADNEPLGATILHCTQAMLDSVQTNTSLGTILLIVPLNKLVLNRLRHDAARTTTLDSQTIDLAFDALWNELDEADSADIYEAIRRTKPGGLGKATSMDVNTEPLSPILEAMRFAASWDDVALQYATNFELVRTMAKRLESLRHAAWEWNDAIRILQLEIMATRPDSLIARKCGRDSANEIMRKASHVLNSGAYGSEPFEREWHRLDQELRDPRHRGNPGTIADLIAAAIYWLIANEPVEPSEIE